MSRVCKYDNTLSSTILHMYKQFCQDMSIFVSAEGMYIHLYMYVQIDVEFSARHQILIIKSIYNIRHYFCILCKYPPSSQSQRERIKLKIECESGP